MRKQYSRAYINKAGEIQHLHTQDTPILHDFVFGDYEKRDFIVEHDEDAHIRAREILDSVEPVGEAVKVKSGATSHRMKKAKVSAANHQ